MMTLKSGYYAIAAAVISGIFISASFAQAAPPAPRILHLNTFQVDLTQVSTPGRGHAPVNIHRHFANPTLLGEVKANLAQAAKKSGGAGGHGGGGSGGGHHGKPTPTPTPSPTPTPTAVPISSGVVTPIPSLTKFGGMDLYGGGGYIPPDTTLGAGPAGGADRILEAVNSLASVYDGSGALLVNLNFSACTTNPSTDSVSDPRVLYDSGSGRWFISTTTFSPIGDASWNLLFSEGSDPSTSQWQCLIVQTGGITNPDGSVGSFPDFPKVGINSNKVVLTGDAFSPVGSSYKYQGTEFIVIDKASLLAGTVNAAYFAPDQHDFAIEPAQHLNSTEDAFYMAAVNSGVAATSTIDVWKITGLPGAGLTTQVTSVPIGTISYPPNAGQKGTGLLIDTNDDSLLDAVYRQGSPGALWVAANDACSPPNDTAVHSCLRFIELSVGGSGVSVAQDFDYADVGTDYYFPSIRSDRYGNIYSAFTGSSASTYPSAYAGMQLSGNPNALTNLSISRAGDYPYTISPPRWGDYSGAAVDPDDSSAWLGAEYSTSLGGILKYWGTSIAHAAP